uniref:Uncharacterized protein n=1 Tax=Anguilla anguilla TaxID=7936 RepID=A0A0E9RIV9_ANGAN
MICVYFSHTCLLLYYTNLQSLIAINAFIF